MKKMIKETAVMLAMPLLLILFMAKVLLTLYEIYAEKKQIKMNIHEI
jgi:type III secretory pathway component EscT